MPIPYWAGHYIGLPFLEHGRSIRGLDCWGLVRLVLHEQFDVCLPSYIREYTHTYHKRDIGRLIRHESRKWSLVPAGQEQCGDVVVLRMRGEPMHVGLILGDQHMMHIERHVNSAIETYTGARWKRRVIGFYRCEQISNKAKEHGQ